jgi:hypothetical protein
MRLRLRIFVTLHVRKAAAEVRGALISARLLQGRLLHCAVAERQPAIEHRGVAAVPHVRALGAHGLGARPLSAADCHRSHPHHVRPVGKDSAPLLSLTINLIMSH